MVVIVIKGLGGEHRLYSYISWPTIPTQDSLTGTFVKNKNKKIYQTTPFFLYNVRMWGKAKEREGKGKGDEYEEEGVRRRKSDWGELKLYRLREKKNGGLRKWVARTEKREKPLVKMKMMREERERDIW